MRDHVEGDALGELLALGSAMVKTALVCENSSSMASLPAPDTDW
jgi:hypothetical protein